MAELLTSLDVVNQSFKKSMRGYDAVEVDEFLDHIAETLQIYAQKTKDLEREVQNKDDALAEYEKMKNVLHEALLMAQKSADDKVRSAREQAARIISDAEKKADDICHDAAAEADRLRDGVQQIRNIKNLYEQEVRGMLAKFDNMLNQCMSGSSLAGAVDSVLETITPEEEPTEEEPAEESKVAKSELEAAYNMLGVDPKDILSD